MTSDHRTDLTRGAWHAHQERAAPGQYHLPPGCRLRLVVFTVSIYGALGPEAQALIRQVSARVARGVPFRLLDEATWATQGCAPYMRMAVTVAARRGLASAIRCSTCTHAQADVLDAQPA